MNLETWKRWGRFAVLGKNDPASRHDHLIAKEAEVLAFIKTGPWMLEQERIPLLDVEKAINSAFSVREN
jgi:hypothetical protein